MTIRYEIDVEAGIVISWLSDTVTEDDLRKFQRTLANDPKFGGSFDALVDLTGVTNFDVTSNGNIRLARTTPYTSGSRRAYVAVEDTPYGMSRLYSVRAERPDQDVRAFRNMEDARAWLGIRKT